MSIIQISDIINRQSIIQDLTSQEIAGIVGGKKGGNKGGGGDMGGGDFGGGTPVGIPTPYPVPIGNANPFIFDEIGPGNSRRDRFVVSPNGDVFQYHRKGNSKVSFNYNPGFAASPLY